MYGKNHVQNPLKDICSNRDVFCLTFALYSKSRVFKSGAEFIVSGASSKQNP